MFSNKLRQNLLVIGLTLSIIGGQVVPVMAKTVNKSVVKPVVKVIKKVAPKVATKVAPKVTAKITFNLANSKISKGDKLFVTNPITYKAKEVVSIYVNGKLIFKGVPKSNNIGLPTGAVGSNVADIKIVDSKGKAISYPIKYTVAKAVAGVKPKQVVSKIIKPVTLANKPVLKPEVKPQVKIEVKPEVKPEAAAKEAATKAAVAKEAIAKEAAAKEVATKAAIAKEVAVKEAIAKEAVAKEAIAKEEAAKEAIAKEEATKEAEDKEAKAKEEAAKAAIAKEAVAKEAATKEAIAKEAAAKEAIAKEAEAKEAAVKEAIAKEVASKEKGIIVNSPEELNNILKNALENFETDVTMKVPNYNENDYKTTDIVMKIVREHPELNYGFEMVGGNQSYREGIQERTLKVEIQYKLDKQEMIRQKSEVEKKVQEVLGSEIKTGMSNFEKEKALHDYIVRSARYDTEHVNDNIPEDHNAYGVLVNGVGVCESYAKAFCVLLKTAGIECEYVSGTGNGGPHGWNIVKLDDEWYNVDVTWDDPTYAKSGDQMIDVSYSNFNVTDDIFNNKHRRDVESNTLEKCTATKYSVENMSIVEIDMQGDEFIRVKSEDELKEKISEALKSKAEKLNLKLCWDNKNGLQYFSDIVQKIAEDNGILGIGWGIKGNKENITYTFN